jgi:hypothetical protein
MYFHLYVFGGDDEIKCVDEWREAELSPPPP